MTIRSITLVLLGLTLLPGAVYGQAAFIGPCSAAQLYFDSITVQRAYRGVVRETPSPSVGCGRDVVTVFNLERRPGSGASAYAVSGRRHYLWPTQPGCDVQGFGEILTGSATLYKDMTENGANCQVTITLKIDVQVVSPQGVRGAALTIPGGAVTTIGPGAQQFAVTWPGSERAGIFYAAQVTPHAYSR